MKKRILAIFLSVCMLMSCIGCNHIEEKNDNSLSQVEPDTEISNCGDTELSQKDIEIGNIPMSVTDFSVRLLQAELQNAKGDVNRLLSPFSVLTVMSMLGNGCKSETKEQIEEVLGLPIENLNEFISRYMQNMSNEEGNRFDMANSIWFTQDQRFTVKEEFLNINQQYYGADIYEKSFDQTTVSEMNQWVEDNTDGLIKEILNEIPADAVMYLVNALVFDAKWEKQYEESEIREGTFTAFDGVEQDIDFMYSEENMYLEDENATGFIKYYEGRDYAFVALLPKEETTLSEYIQNLTGESLFNLLSNGQEVKTYVWLPQLKVEYQAELKDTLEILGITDVFDIEKADLSGLGTSTHGNLYVDRVIHKTYMEVSPVGTKAGAATIVEVKDECAMIEPPEVKEVRLDRPFLYMIIDCDSNLPVFMGSANYISAYRCGVMDNELCGYPTEEEFELK